MPVGPTTIEIGDPRAVSLYSRALFSETMRMPSMRGVLSGPAPRQTAAMRKLRMPAESPPTYPIQTVMDLERGQGEEVSVDLVSTLRGLPTMGDDKIAGRGESQRYSSMQWRIDQTRHMADAGGRMSAKRTIWNLRQTSRAQLVDYFNRLEDQICLVHMAGARGGQGGGDWIVPSDDHAEFNRIMVNPVQAPTKNRQFFAGDATSVEDISSTDVLTLGEIDKLRKRLDETAFPLPPVYMDGDMGSGQDRLYILYVTPSQWYHIKTDTGDQNWREFLAATQVRRAMTKNHPLFTGECGMWSGILIKKLGRVIRFYPGDTVKQTSDDAGTVGTKTVGSLGDDNAVDRAILLGGQALGQAFGRAGQSGTFAQFNEELTDHKNAVEISGSLMGGKAKLRFRQNGTGPITDHGVAVIDSYVSDVSAHDD